MKKIAFVLLLLCVVVSSTSLHAHATYWCSHCLCYHNNAHCCHGDGHYCNDCKDCKYHIKKAQSTLAEIYLLEQKKAANEIAKRQISRVKILKARFYKKYTTDTLPLSMAEITIENKSDYPVKTIFFNGKLITHKTGQVLINDTFRYDVYGTFDAGKTNAYNIALNSYGKWAKANPPDLAKFDVVVTGIQTSDGTSFVNSFSDEDAKKLNDLKNK
jgi:hypothetical protein